MTDIRRATLEDLDLIAPLFDGYRRFYGQPADVERAKTYLRERLENNESVVLLAMQGDKPAGFTQLYPIFSSVRTTVNDTRRRMRRNFSSTSFSLRRSVTSASVNRLSFGGSSVTVPFGATV